MTKKLFILLFLTLAAYGQQEQKRVAILNTEGEGDLIYLSVRLREIAVKVLPKDKYSIMTAESIIDKMGSRENALKICREAQCLAEIGRKVSAAYVGQARVGSFGGNYTIFMELYNAGSGTLVDSFTGEAKDLSGLLKVINEKAPQMFRKMPGVSGGRIIDPGIENLSKSEDYELNEEKRYLVNLSTEPPGAVLNFDGEPIASCKETPCKAELREGNVRIIAALEQYEKADTTVSIKRKNQNIAITLKPNFGVLEIKPAYLDGIGKAEGWSLSVNNKNYPLGDVNLSPNKYKVKLSHDCYENIDFNAGINKGKREVFDMSGKITLKKGGLALSAERDGEPVSEPVFVNGKQVGETPFSGSVPLCARVEIGDSRELVDVALKYKEKVNHTYSFYVSKPAKPAEYTSGAMLDDFYHSWKEETYAQKNTEKPPKPVPERISPDTILCYISIHKSNIANFYDYKNEELYRSKFEVIFGFEALPENKRQGNRSSGGSLFIGYGALGEYIGEFILGLDFRSLFWLSERIVTPISLGFAWRMQWDGDFEDKLIAEIINDPNPNSRNIRRHNFDIMPAIDFQVFLGSSFAIYVGYMYRITYSSNWGFDYDGTYYEVPEKYNSLKNSKEEIFGIPGVLRFGIKL